MKYKITIEDSEGHKVVLPCESTHLLQEIGMNLIVGPDSTTNCKPNGQYRLLIKGWTGCASYESFQTDAPKDRNAI